MNTHSAHPDSAHSHSMHGHAMNASVAPLERNWIRGLVLTCALAIAVWVGLAASSHFVDPRAVPAGCVTLATSKTDAVVTLAIVWTLLTLLGMGVGRLVNAVVGTFVVGAGCAALALRSSGVDGAIFDQASMTALGAETLMWAVPVTITLVAIFRFSGSLPDIAPRFTSEPWWKEYFDLDAIRAGLVGALLPIVAWLVVRNMLKGQAFGGACLGGITVGIAYRLIAPQITPLFAFVAPLILMGLYQMFVASRVTADLSMLFAAGALAPELRVMPADSVAGSLTGVAIGLGWARSFRRSDTITT